MNANFNVLLKVDGSAWSMGLNNCGQLGIGNVTNCSSPVAVVGNHSFVYITNGGYTTTTGQSFGLKVDGSEWAWGYNFSGQLGTGNTASCSSPVAVVGNHAFVAIRAGNTFTAARKPDGSVWTWGNNTSGQLGTGDRVNRSSPVAVVGNHTFVKIVIGNDDSATAGLEYMTGLKDDGTVWAWGNNASGQLGTNNLTSRSSPVLVIGNHSFIDIAAGTLTSYGLKNDGSVWAWGANDVGQVGNGLSLTSYSSPVAVVGNHSFQKIATNCFSAYGLKADGSLWAWGANGSGALGNSSLTSASSPIAVVGSRTFVQMFGGRRWACALNPDSSLSAWGYNGFGQLGDNTITDKSSPIQVVGSHLFMQVGDQPVVYSWAIDVSADV